jgi:hypothetical protein
MPYYGYRGLKIFTSLTLRFQDFQHKKSLMVSVNRQILPVAE